MGRGTVRSQVTWTSLHVIMDDGQLIRFMDVCCQASTHVVRVLLVLLALSNFPIVDSRLH